MSPSVVLPPTVLDGMDCVALDYEMGWPLSAVITQVSHHLGLDLNQLNTFQIERSQGGGWPFHPKPRPGSAKPDATPAAIAQLASLMPCLARCWCRTLCKATLLCLGCWCGSSVWTSCCARCMGSSCSCPRAPQASMIAAGLLAVYGMHWANVEQGGNGPHISPFPRLCRCCLCLPIRHLLEVSPHLPP